MLPRKIKSQIKRCGYMNVKTNCPRTVEKAQPYPQWRVLEQGVGGRGLPPGESRGSLNSGPFNSCPSQVPMNPRPLPSEKLHSSTSQTRALKEKTETQAGWQAGQEKSVGMGGTACGTPNPVRGECPGSGVRWGQLTAPSVAEPRLCGEPLVLLCGRSQISAKPGRRPERHRGCCGDRGPPASPCPGTDPP